MTNLATDTTASDDAVGADTPSTIIQFALKNGAGDVEVDTALLPNEVYKEVLIQGLKAIAERNMSKLTKEAYPDEGQRKQAIHDRAMENVQAMYDGKIKITGAAKVKKASGAVMTEAMLLARNLIKDAMKANKIKISTVKASEITKAAKAYIETNPGLIATAEANIKAREETPMTLDIKSLIKVDPELVAKDEAKKAKAKADKPLSKAQAGKVAPRAKGTKPGAGANA